MKFDKNGKLIKQKENHVINHSDYWQNEIDIAIKENKNIKRTLSEFWDD